MLRFFLPPNLPAAAARNAVAVKLDCDLSVAPPPEFLPALALLQTWCGTPTPPKFLQLNRAQLDALVAALRGQSVFYWINQPSAPIAWNSAELPGVSEHLVEQRPATAQPLATPTPAAPVSARRAKLAPDPLVVDGSEHFLACTLPSREHPQYSALVDLLKSHGFVLETSNRKWWLRDRHKTLNFLAQHRRRLTAEFNAQFTANFERNTAHLRFAELVCAAEAAGDNFEVTLGLKAGSSGADELRQAVATNRGYVESEGRVYLLETGQLQQLATAQRALAGDPAAGVAARRTLRIPAARVAESQAVLETLSPNFQPPEAWRARASAMRELAALSPAPLSAPLSAQLRPYQKLGVAWLWYLFRQQLGGILADEMGLGKTLQALGLLSALHSTRPNRAALVVAPASLLENWRREAARFAPELRVFVHHGAQRLANAADFHRYDLVITSYGTLTRDRELCADTEFAAVIADEAQHIKNRRSQNAQALRALRTRGRFLLTGTPMENSLDDLRSLFEFLLPGFLDPLPSGLRSDERAWYDERLRARTAPYILRRTKQAVAPELPAKLEQTLWCELTPAQAALYRAAQERTERELLDLAATGANEARLRFAMLTQLLRLRQICCDPRLAGVAAEAEETSNSSAKLAALLELLDEALDDGHRVLIFSQFTSLLELLRPELEALGLSYCYLDGSMSARARQLEVDRFQGTPTIPLFLLSLKAGGTGLNLTGADTVVHFDPWWNPAVEAQATDRAHRIGQTRVVTSYKLICSGTVEEKVLALQEEKRALLAGVFEASEDAAAKLSLADLRSLLAV